MQELREGTSLSLVLDFLKKAESYLQRFSSNPNLLVTTYSNMANANRTRGNLDASVRCAEKALQIAKGTTDMEGDSLPCAHLTMCCILSQMANHEEALEHAQQAVSQCLEFLIPIRKGPVPLNAKDHGEQLVTLCIAYHNVGVQFEFLTRYSDAIPWYERAVDTSIKYLPAKEDMISSFSASLQAAEAAVRRKEKNEAATMVRLNANSFSYRDQVAH